MPLAPNAAPVPAPSTSLNVPDVIEVKAGVFKDTCLQLLDQVHAQAYQSVPYINAGQFRTLAAYRSNVEGLRATTIPVFWGVEKK